MKPLVCYASDWRRLQADFDATRTLAHFNPHAAGEELVSLEIQAGWLAILMRAWNWVPAGCRALGGGRYNDLLCERRSRPASGDDSDGLGGVAAMEWHSVSRLVRDHRPERVLAGLPDRDEDLSTWPAGVLRANVIGGGGHFHASRARAFSQVCGIMAEECEAFEEWKPSPTPPIANTGGGSPSQRRALQSLEWAVAQRPKFESIAVTTGDNMLPIHQYLTENECPQYAGFPLPTFHTWLRYIRAARPKNADPKLSPPVGRSVIRADQK